MSPVTVLGRQPMRAPARSLSAHLLSDSSLFEPDPVQHFSAV